ncbi:hypothetical protein CCH79_00000469, partial [Gambusia affinis]
MPRKSLILNRKHKSVSQQSVGILEELKSNHNMELTVRFRMAQLMDGAGKLSWVLLKSVMRFTFMFFNNCVAIPSYCLYLLLLQPLRIWDSSAFWHIEGVMFKWLLAMVSSWGWIAGYTGEVLQWYRGGFAGRSLWSQFVFVLLVFQWFLVWRLHRMPYAVDHFLLLEGRVSPRKLAKSSGRGTEAVHLTEWGDDVRDISEEEAMVIVNHQSTGDVCTLMMCLQDKGTVVRKMMWLMDHVFKYTNFGLVSLIHGDFFIRQGKAYRDKQLIYLKEHLEKYYHSRDRKWIVLFPEGGFLRKRRETSQLFAKKNCLPHLTHVTLPRLGATHVILKTLSAQQENGSVGSDSGTRNQRVNKNKGLQWVIDVTIAYPKARPMDIQTWIFGYRPPTVTHVHYRSSRGESLTLKFPDNRNSSSPQLSVFGRRVTKQASAKGMGNRMYPIKEVPTEAKALTDWLYQRFVEKEELLAHFYNTGSFPPPDGQKEAVSRQMTLDPMWLCMVQSFAFASGYM